MKRVVDEFILESFVLRGNSIRTNLNFLDSCWGALKFPIDELLCMNIVYSM